MASRVQQDLFIDDDDESWSVKVPIHPLCVEELDLSDKNFRPCPCGYQVCQFCYNNIKNQMNGLCPACRRPYDDESIEWKIVSPEEQKADIALQAKKKAQARKQESEQRQVETTNRKNLAGIRVVQKNLVYVVGLSQKSSEEEFLRTLRGPQYFGQYGKITKIVVSKAKEGQNTNNSIGIYVTFENKEDAARCIAAVDGSQNLDRPLRAQYGTTKYCSAFLRNEACGNRNCTFLHETGEDNDSFSRQDLSSMNALSTQRPAQQASSSRAAQQQQPPQPQPPHQQAPQNISAAPHPGPISAARAEPMSRSDSGDGPGLPSSATWAAKNAHNESRRSSKPASVVAPSPVMTSSSIPPQPPGSQPAKKDPKLLIEPSSPPSQPPAVTTRQRFPEPPNPLDAAMKKFTTKNIEYKFDRSMYNEEDLKQIEAIPPLFDKYGGLVRWRRDQEDARKRQQLEEERNTIGAMSAVEEDEAHASGSLQLGGEPETQEEPKEISGRTSAQHRGTIQPPFGSASNFAFRGSAFQAQSVTNPARALTPQQQQHQLSLVHSHSNRQSPVNAGQFQQAYAGNTSLHHHQQSNPFQIQNQAFNTAQGHTRQASRFDFANDSTSASTAVKPVANPQLMAQQSAMMPANQNKHFQSQGQQQNAHGNHFYSGVQGPPPGLKSSGTPPISGGGMFGQGHGFASAMGGSTGFSGNTGSKNSNDDLMRELMRNRNGSINGQGSDVGKREFKFPFAQQPMTSDAPAPSLLSSLYGSQLGAHHGYQDHNLQKQKKKGKKHRHANTSSSGGGGIVDLADPSILQARMHHGAAGQGQFGAQGQDRTVGPRPQRISPPVPIAIPDVPLDSSTAPTPSRVTAKTFPIQTSVTPGLSLPQDFPPLAAPSAPAPTPLSIPRKVTIKNIKPVIPVVPALSTRPAITHKDSQSVERAPADVEETPLDVPVTTKNDLQTGEDQATEKDEASKPALIHKPSDLDEVAIATTNIKTAEKKQRPSKLDIAAAKDASKATFTGAKSTAGETTSGVSLSQPSTPATAASQASASTRSKQPRTIRVSREDVQQQPASPGTLASATTSRQASRRPSLTSAHRPDTPASEKVSDYASITSASISRANSPPPNKVGSAPVRQVTKSQQKKERQARAKHAEAATKSEEVPSKTEEVQAPIFGRKKKTKKEKTQGTAESTPTATRPTSPVPKEEDMEAKFTPAPAPVTPVKENKRNASKAVSDSKEPDTPSSPATPAGADQHKTQLTAAAIFAHLQKAGEISASAADLFKPVPGINHRFEVIEPSDTATDNPISDDQRRLLNHGEPIHIDKGRNNQVVLLPDHRSLRGLTVEEATRYVQLRKRDWLNGDVPSHQALDGLIPPLSPVDAEFAVSSAKSAIRNKRLDNPFMSAVAESEPDASDNADNGTAVLAGTVGGGIIHRKATMNVADAEKDLHERKKVTEQWEKKLNAVLKKNRRLLFGNSH